MAQSSFYSANDPRLHFGLGAATSAELTIRWPNGAIERLEHVEADQLVVVREGSGIPHRQKFGKWVCARDRRRWLFAAARGGRNWPSSTAAHGRHRHRRRHAEGHISPLSTASSSSSCSRASSMGCMRNRFATAASRTPPNQVASHPHGNAIPTIATMITLSRPGAMTKWRIRTRSGRRERPAGTRCASI